MWFLSSELSGVGWTGIFTDTCYSFISDALAQIQNKHPRRNGGALCFHSHDQEQNITHWRTSWGQTWGMLRRSNTTKLFQAGVPPPYHKQYIKGNFLNSFLESNLCHSYRHFPNIFIFVVSIFDSVGRKSDNLWILLLPFNSTDNSCGNIHIRITSWMKQYLARIEAFVLVA